MKLLSNTGSLPKFSSISAFASFWRGVEADVAEIKKPSAQVTLSYLDAGFIGSNAQINARGWMGTADLFISGVMFLFGVGLVARGLYAAKMGSTEAIPAFALSTLAFATAARKGLSGLRYVKEVFHLKKATPQLTAG